MRCNFTDIAYAKIEARLYADIHKLSLTNARNNFAILCGYRDWKDLVRSPRGEDGCWDSTGAPFPVNADFALLSLYGPDVHDIRKYMQDTLFLPDEIRALLVTMRHHLAYSGTDRIMNIFIQGDEVLREKFEALARKYMDYCKANPRVTEKQDEWTRAIITSRCVIPGVPCSDIPITTFSEKEMDMSGRENGFLLMFYDENQAEAVQKVIERPESQTTRISNEIRKIFPTNPGLISLFKKSIKSRSDLDEVRKFWDAFVSKVALRGDYIYLLPSHLFPDNKSFISRIKTMDDDIAIVALNEGALTSSEKKGELQAFMRSDPDIIMAKTSVEKNEYNRTLMKFLLIGHPLILFSEPLNLKASLESVSQVPIGDVSPVPGWPNLYHVKW